MTVFPRGHSTAPSHTLATLDPFGKQVARHLRLWSEGKAGPQAITDELTDHLGPQRGARVAMLWCELCDIFQRFGHRPLEILPRDSAALSADEAGFVQLLSFAAEARREDAMFAALMMVRADVTPIVASLATQVGLSLRQTMLRAENAAMPATHHTNPHLH